MTFLTSFTTGEKGPSLAAARIATGLADVRLTCMLPTRGALTKVSGAEVWIEQIITANMTTEEILLVVLMLRAILPVLLATP
mmetsp:Transcript_13329/g.30397  ORF Transcript_13329/g.30397 Transcript_13329/m.30397 type:complete len:82 (-) Transcript_13329:46-291(-)